MTDTQQPVINGEACTGCTICAEECPTNALQMDEDIVTLARPHDCNGCGTCEEVCPVAAILL